jgi:hypothetical protein
MSRKQPTVVVVEGSRRGARTTVSAVDARQIRAETIAARDQRRKGRTLYRLRRHLAPWWAAVTVMALGATTWLVDWLTDHQAAVTVAALTACVVLFVGWMIARRSGRWRRRVITAAVVAALWLAWVAQTGPTWDAPLVLLVATVAIAARWWSTVRIPHPKAPTPPEPARKEGPIELRWANYVANQKGALPDSYLTDKDTSQKNRTVFTGQLVPGQQTLGMAISGMERIASGLDTPFTRLIIEPHPDLSPRRIRVTIVEHSPIEKTVQYQGPRVHDGIIDLGPYADGGGFGPWRLWTPGEVPNGGSWWGGGIFAGMGIGKSRLIELISIGALSTGYAAVWFIDPQGGASSPALKDHADWYADADGAPAILGALERITAWRGKQMAKEGWIGFDPRPERPGILVIIDEAHEVLARNTNRWKTLTRKARKVGIGIVAVSQYPGLDTFGGQEPLRAAILAGNVVAMRAESNQNGQLIPGLEVDPKTLPELPGFGYTVRRAGAFGRTAPYRAEYVADPGHWLKRYPPPPLDALSANAAGDEYLSRQGAMEAARLEAAADVEAMEAGRPATWEPSTSKPESSNDAMEASEPPAFPAPPTLHVVPPAPEPQGNGRGRILAALADGPASPKMLRDNCGLGETRVATLLKELIADGIVEQQGRGLYRLS